MIKRLALYTGVACLLALALQSVLTNPSFAEAILTLSAFSGGTAFLSAGCFVVYYLQVRKLKVVQSFKEAGYLLEHMADCALSFVLGLSICLTLESAQAPTLFFVLDILALVFTVRVWQEITWFNEQESKQDKNVVHE